MDVCQVGGKTLGTKDKVYTSFLQCEGLGNCRKKVHPFCTVTPRVSPRACAHAYCCRMKLHDVIPRWSPCFAMMLQILAVKSALSSGLPPYDLLDMLDSRPLFVERMHLSGHARKTRFQHQ
jgi:hypothetical protein